MPVRHHRAEGADIEEIVAHELRQRLGLLIILAD